METTENEILVNTVESIDSDIEAAEQEPRRYRPLIILLILSVLVNAAIWLVLYRRIPYTDGIVFLHYNIYYGVDRVGTWNEMWWIPGTGAAALLLNTLFVGLMRRVPQAIAVLALSVTLAVQVMLFVAAILVVLLNY